MENFLTIETKFSFQEAKIIVVSNYFLPFDNKVVNWHLNNNYFSELSHCFDIGVWKIKQLKQ